MGRFKCNKQEQPGTVVDIHGHPTNSGSRMAFLLRTQSCACSQQGYWHIWEHPS